MYVFIAINDDHNSIIEPCFYNVVFIKLYVITLLKIECYITSQVESYPDATLYKLIKLFMRKAINFYQKHELNVVVNTICK